LFLTLLLLNAAWSADTFQNQTFYYGDIHFQTGASGDGGASDMEGTCDEGDCGAIADITATALAAGLDFLAVTDHANGPNGANAYDFNEVLHEVLSAHVEGEFVVLPGAEFCCWQEEAGGPGHRNIYFFEDADFSELERDDFLPTNEDGSDVNGCEEMWGWMERMEETYGDVLLIPHHPARENSAVDWGCFDSRYTPTVEVYSYHGSSMGDGDNFDPLSNLEESGTVHTALDPEGYNHQMGFVAASDFHDSRPGQVCATDPERSGLHYGAGITVAVLGPGESFNRQALYRAFTERRTYATSGPMLPVSLKLRVDGVSNGRGMGSDVLLLPDQQVELILAIPPMYAPSVNKVILVTPTSERLINRSGRDWTATFSAADAPAWAYFRVEIDGSTFWGGDCADGGLGDAERIWLSPNWFTVVGAGDDTGGADTGDTGGAGGADSGTDSGDTGSAEGGDTGSTDTGSTDTGSTDTGSTDTGSDTGAGNASGGGDTADTGAGNASDGGDTADTGAGQ
jgi:hypothetical protein